MSFLKISGHISYLFCIPTAFNQSHKWLTYNIGDYLIDQSHINEIKPVAVILLINNKINSELFYLLQMYFNPHSGTPPKHNCVLQTCKDTSVHSLLIFLKTALSVYHFFLLHWSFPLLSNQLYTHMNTWMYTYQPLRYHCKTCKNIVTVLFFFFNSHPKFILYIKVPS